MSAMLITRFELMCLVGGAWRPAASLLGGEASLVDEYLSSDRRTCCSFQAGFFIDIDGASWSDASTVDELWMTMCWFVAIDALLDGAVDAGPMPGPWEESRLTWRRESGTGQIVMEDVHFSGRISMRRVEVPFDDLSRRLAEEGRVLAALTRAIQREVAARRERTPNEETRRRLDLIARSWPPEGELGLAIIDRVIARVIGIGKMA